MGAFSNILEAKIVDHFLRNTSQASPATVYLALFESDPAEDGSGTEVSYTGYARKASTWSAIDGAGATKNTSALTFDANGNASSAVVVTHCAIFDALTNGNMLMYGVLSAAKTLEVSDVLAFPSEALILTLN